MIAIAVHCMCKCFVLTSFASHDSIYFHHIFTEDTFTLFSSHTILRFYDGSPSSESKPVSITFIVIDTLILLKLYICSK